MNTNIVHNSLDPAHFRPIDSLPIRGTTPDLLNMKQVVAHIERAIQRGRYQGDPDPITYLRTKHCLVQDGSDLHVTTAGLLCFGNNPQEILPHAVVNMTHYRGMSPDSTNAIHIERHIGGTIFDQLAHIDAYLQKNTYHGMTILPGSMERTEIDEYPTVVRRELTVNMLAHREYTEVRSVAQVQLFANRIEWSNPGGLPEGVTPEQLIHMQRSRNPALFTILWERGLIEGVGQGLDTVIAVLAREQLPPLRFDGTNQLLFVISVQGRPLDVLQSQNLYSRLTERQRQILLIIRTNTSATAQDFVDRLGRDVTRRSVQRDLKDLLQLNLIRSQGGSRNLRYTLFDTPDDPSPS